jgi:hypothetical protein
LIVDLLHFSKIWQRISTIDLLHFSKLQKCISIIDLLHFSKLLKWIANITLLHFYKIQKWISIVDLLHFSKLQKWISIIIMLHFSKLWKWMTTVNLLHFSKLRNTYKFFLVNLGWIWVVDLKIRCDLNHHSIKLSQLLHPQLKHNLTFQVKFNSSTYIFISLILCLTVLTQFKLKSTHKFGDFTPSSQFSPNLS